MYRTFKILWLRNSKRWLNKLVAWRIANISERNFIYLLSLIIGLLSGFAALVLKNLIHFVAEKLTHWFTVDGISYLYLVYPFIGILLTVLFVKYFIKDNIGHGVAKILYSISRKSSRIKAHNTYSSMIASSLTIGFGGSVGLEAPTVATGAAIGSNVGRLFHLNYKQITLLIGVASAAAIAAIFKSPLSSDVFLLIRLSNS